MSAAPSPVADGDRRVAVVGAGIAGLACAYALRHSHRVTLFEADRRAGGHSNTVDVVDSGRHLAIDTGFIVHNRENYPRFNRLLDDLGIATQRSEMSFAVESPATGVAYRGSRVWLQPELMTTPATRRTAVEIARFQRRGPELLGEDLRGLGLRDLVDRFGFRRELLEHYLVPLGTALWSMPHQDAGDIPAEFALRFLDHHSLFGLRRYRWRTISGGSRVYVQALLRRLTGPVFLGTPIRSITRRTGEVVVRTDLGEAPFDAVILATHADQALGLLADPDPLESEILGAFRTTPNRATLHTDASLLPANRRIRSSWNVTYPPGGDGAPTVTYSMNRLQRLRTRQQYCVSLNAERRIRPERVVAEFDYRHPVMDHAAIAAQRRVPELQGRRNTYFCGAWQGWGFHEDAMAAAERAVEAIRGPR